MLRFGRRSYGTLVKIWPRGAPAATSGEGPCVYITGFMSDTKDDGYWESWLPAHRQLVAAPLPWPEQAYGYRWQTGATGDWLGRWPLPVHAAALLARRSSPAALLAGITADSLVNATRCTPAILFSHHPLLSAHNLTSLTPRPHHPHHTQPRPSHPHRPTTHSTAPPPGCCCTTARRRARLWRRRRALRAPAQPSEGTTASWPTPSAAGSCSRRCRPSLRSSGPARCGCVARRPLARARTRPRSRRVEMARGAHHPALTPPRQVHLLAAAATMEAHAPRLAQLCTPRAGKVYHYYCADDEALASGRQEVGRK